MQTDAPREGAIYVATGAEYLDLTLDAAASLRAACPGLAVDLFTDLPGPATEAGLFDRVHLIERPHLRSKLDCLPRTRFPRTLFLDSDTRVVRDITDSFALLERFDLALAHDVRRTMPLIREGWREETPYAFPQHNSGVMFYRRSPAMLAFLEAWRTAYAASGGGRDQVTLKDLLWASDLRFYVLPPEFNLRRVTELDAWEPLDALPSIFHSHIFLRHLREPGTAKVRAIAEVLEIERAALRAEWASWNRARGVAGDAADWGLPDLPGHAVAHGAARGAGE
ncbi:MAG: hypothetical protein JJU40_13830 [Rhodobacteraceae bacterium]|nr:hypothetical protein [Paracoccaceae bacterium]